MSERSAEYIYANKVGNLISDISEHLEKSEEERISLVMRIAALEAQNAKLRLAARDVLNAIPRGEIEIARASWGNTNTRIIQEALGRLAALLTEAE